MSYFGNVYRGRYILMRFVKNDLKNKYRNTFLGISWSLLTPLGLVGIIGTVFSAVFGIPLKTFLPFLASGLIPWLFIQACAIGGNNAFLSAQGYIKQTKTPVEIFPIRVAIVEFINLLFALCAFFIIYLALCPEKFSPIMLLVFPALLIWLVLGISLSTITALINTHIRDYGPIQALLLQGIYYGTPIMWLPSVLDKKNLSWVYEFNPIYYVMSIIRNPLLGEKIPSLSLWIIAIAITLLVALIAVFSMKRIGRKITFRL